MRIKRGPIVFHNVISCTETCKMNEWHPLAQKIRNSVISSGLYGTGPIIYQVSNLDEGNQEAEYTFHVPVNAPVLMQEGSPYRFAETLTFADGLLLRHADLDEDIEESYEILRACAESQQLVLKEAFYNIYLDVYGDGIIDIYAPVVGGSE